MRLITLLIALQAFSFVTGSEYFSHINFSRISESEVYVGWNLSVEAKAIRFYVVYRCENCSSPSGAVVPVDSSSHNYTLKDLNPKGVYTGSVYAVDKSGGKNMSPKFTFSSGREINVTKWEANRNSTCNPWGTLTHYDNNTCSCDNGYTGDECNECIANFYSTLTGECKKCTKCSPHYTSETCSWDPMDNVPHCDHCKTNATGPSCTTCEPGFSFRRNYCLPCNCTGSPSICKDSTGQCTNCSEPTTGDHCEYCRDSRLKNPPRCAQEDRAFTIILFCLVFGGILLVVLTVVCFFLRHKMRETRRRRMQALWNVNCDADGDFVDEFVESPGAIDGGQLRKTSQYRPEGRREDYGVLELKPEEPYPSFGSVLT